MFVKDRLLIVLCSFIEFLEQKLEAWAGVSKPWKRRKLNVIPRMEKIQAKKDLWRRR